MNKAKGFMRLGTALSAILLLTGIVGNRQLTAAPSTEMQTLVVAYLYNFMKLSEWPTEVPGNALTLCITQEGDLAKELDALAENEAQNYTLKIRRVIQGDNVRECQLLYLPANEKPVRIQEWLNTLKDIPVLTVSDLKGFLDQGGMIALIDEGGRLQFEVNLARVTQVKIKLSSKMLQIARSVSGR